MKRKFLFVAAENDGIPRCKAGGMGDVVRDVPRQIASRGDLAHVITPSYSRLHNSDATKLTDVHFVFRGVPHNAEIFEVTGKKEITGIKHYVLHHPDIKAGDIAHIYYNDPDQPFYTDANVFSLFCTAVAAAIRDDAFGKIDILHLHDWHTSMLLFLREFNPRFQNLRNIRMVYSIHNLAIQGIRPFDNNYSSVQAFFPDINYDRDKLYDRRYPDCINLMAVGIRLADAVHTVSPSYKEDIQKPSDPPHFIGGEGLEEDLQQAEREGRLFGILNGANYSDVTQVEKGILWRQCVRRLFRWLQEEKKDYKAHYMAHTGEKITRWQEHKPDFICTSVARLTEQKFYFFKKEPGLLRGLMEKLQKVNGVYILLGTGAPEYEEIFREASYEFKNFIFINAQSESIIDMLYQESDLYLMPSQFEPCGISQMLAMRNGQPCLVHNTGGLKDTVRHLVTGFSFDGVTTKEKIGNFLRVFSDAVDLYFQDRSAWNEIAANARKERFTWEKSVDTYYKELYSPV
ncbi:glycogen synthase [Christiangramia sabulilitoris]|uniref:starch synthase n=1 Tax=Christiangramia sabulilitoris TaxID=2583991 RepID=A0A550I499_9FLAO|nr:glycogen/starch synthase [Christiangramia sabulilitoris]TRO65658.1 glycogen synthase [Christiangramia sabulilitoris]